MYELVQTVNFWGLYISFSFRMTQHCRSADLGKIILWSKIIYILVFAARHNYANKWFIYHIRHTYVHPLLACQSSK